MLLDQLDQRLKPFIVAGKQAVPEAGWIRTIRTGVQMGLRQLGNRLHVTPQAVQRIEKREQDGSITLRRLKEVAEAMDMDLVYGFIPKDGSLNALLDRKAREVILKAIPSATESRIDSGVERLRAINPRRLWRGSGRIFPIPRFKE